MDNKGIRIMYQILTSEKKQNNASSFNIFSAKDKRESYYFVIQKYYYLVQGLTN